MARRNRRAWGRREFKRTVHDKTMRFFELHEQGYSRETIASSLGISLAEVDELLEAMADTVTPGGRGVA